MKNVVGRKLFSLPELFMVVYYGMRSMPYLAKSRRAGELSPEFMERIMLAVTEVNGCAICSYAHTKVALQAGMSNEEIQNLLSGVLTDVPSEEVQAILFAQHYADSRGKPAEDTWERIIETYGLSKAQGILGAIRVIMMGNAHGIPWSSFINRFKGKADKRSSLLYEAEVIILGSLLMPLAMLAGLFAVVFRREIIRFRS